MEKIRIPIGTNNWNTETYRNNLENIFRIHRNALFYCPNRHRITMEQTEKSQNWGFWDPAVITLPLLFMPTYPQLLIILRLTRKNTKDLVFIQHIIQALKLFT